MPDVVIPYSPRRWAQPFHASYRRWAALVMHRRGGKCAPLDSTVLTPVGFRRMGDLKVGDPVVTPSGRYSSISGIFPQGVCPIFDIRLADGSTTQATADHLWAVSFANRRRKDQVVTTGYLREFLERESHRSLKNRSRPLLDMIDQSAEFGVAVSCPVDPYVLGLLLGNGGVSQRSSVRYSTTDTETLGAFSRCGYPVRHISRYDYAVRGLVPALSSLGLMGARSETKHIPLVYLEGTRATRLAVLQGLLDYTDGSTDGTSIEFCSASETMARQVAWLARSLGCMATVRDGGLPTYTYKGEQRIGQRRWRVHIRAPQGLVPFRVARKRDGFTGYRWAKSRAAIVSITPAGEAECQCIAIDDPDQLYVTDDFIVTHNTTATLNHHQRAALDDAWESARLRYLEPSFTDADIAELLQHRQYGHILPLLGQAKSVAWEPLKRIASVVPGATPNEAELSIKYRRQEVSRSRVAVTGPLNPDAHTTVVRLFGADNPDAFRGMPFSGVAYDEYSQHPPNIHGEVVSKTLADHLGYGIFAGTIKGKNQLYRTYEATKDDPAWFSLWRDVNVTLATESGATITAIRRAMKDDRRQIEMGLMLQSEYDQEWYLSPSAAIKGAYYGKLLEDAAKDGRITKVPYDSALKVHDVWDLGTGPRLAVGLFQKHGRSVHMIDYLQGSESDGIPQMIARLQERRYVWGLHFAPHDVRATNIGSGKTSIEMARALGWQFEVVPQIGIDDGIKALQLLLPRMWIDETACSYFLDALSQYRQEWDERRGMFRDQPLHNWASHPADCARYMAVVEDQMVNDRARVPARMQPRPARTPNGWMA